MFTCVSGYLFGVFWPYNFVLRFGSYLEVALSFKEENMKYILKKPNGLEYRSTAPGSPLNDIF